MDNQTNTYSERPLWQWILLYVVIAAIIYGVIYYFLTSKDDIYSTNSYQQNLTDQTSTVEQGRVVIALKDAATTGLNGATAIVITVNKVEVRSAKDGWVIISTATKQYDLLQLKQSGTAALLADTNIATGTYDQIRLKISRADVTVAEKTQQAKLPSSTLKIIGSFTVSEGKISSAVVDILADKSLHLTGNGKFILSPVVKLETKNDTAVEISSDGTVTLTGGKIETDKTVGMDARGETNDDFELKGDLEVDEEDRINLDGKVVIKIDDENNESDETEKDESDNSKIEDKDNSSNVLNFSPNNNSGLSGTAKLKEENGKVSIELELRGGILSLLSSSEPAHIHLGSCPDVGAVKYGLNPVVNGKSETIVNTTLAELKASLPLAINVHKSTEEMATYIACADIKF